MFGTLERVDAAVTSMYSDTLRAEGGRTKLTIENPATALQAILRRIIQTKSGDLRNAWHAILEAPVGSGEFARRHSAVINLWQEVHNLLSGLPDGDAEREQYLGYMSHYYNVLVYPQGWNVGPDGIGNATTIDHLTGIASTFRYRVLTPPPATDDAIARLRVSISEWRDILDEAGFDEKFANELHAQLNHLGWLLDNMTLFGARPVVEASMSLAGASIVAMGTKPSFAKRIGKATAGFVAFVTLFNPVVDQATGMIEGMTELRDAVIELITPPKEIEGPPDIKQLTTGHDRNVIEGEVVDPPESPTPEEGAQG